MQCGNIRNSWRNDYGQATNDKNNTGLHGKPVVKAWIFGSFARGEEKAKSDIDILFVPDFEQGTFTLLTHGGMYEDLKQLLGREVDLVADGSLRPYAKESAEHDKILVYERVC